MFYLMLLYAGLNSPEYEVREAAEWGLIRRVNAQPWAYGEPLSRWAAGATSPEVARRVRRPVRIYDQWRVDRYRPKGIPVWPVCDCYPRRVFPGIDVRDRRAVEPSMYGEYKGNDRAPLWYRWRKGTEQMARQLIREGRPPAEVDDLLLRMWRLELAAGSDCQKRAELETWQGRPWAGGYPPE